MSKNGHYQKVRRPTGLEVYNDAAKILEELLEKRIDRDMKAGMNARPRRNCTDPIKQRETSVYSNTEVTVARCRTMPSRYRESTEDVTKEKESENVEKKKDRIRLKKGIAVDMDLESGTSANETGGESDADDKIVTKNRRKKSVFKRVKENLIRTFHRDQKDGFGKQERDKNESSSVKKRKAKKKQNPVISESKRNVKGRLNEDRSIDYTEVVDYRCSDATSNTESLSHKTRMGSISRNSLVGAIKKSLKKSHSKEILDDDNSYSGHNENGVKSNSRKDTVPSPIPPRQLPNLHSTAASIHRYTPPEKDRDGKKDSSVSPNSSKSPPSSDGHPLNGGGGTLSSTTSTVYPTSDYNNSVGSLNALPSSKSNILDSPGEDIQFMDEVEMEKRKSIIKYHGSEGLLNLQWLAEQTANAKAFNFEIDECCVSTADQTETTTTFTATRTVQLPELMEEDENDIQDGSDKKQNPAKDEIYGKIAQKLIKMADTYGFSDTDMRGESAAAEIGDAPLTDLEKEIIECLRAGGDKYDKKIEGQIEALKGAVQDDAYDRFRSTIDNTMGQDLSWNTVALLFYATKGVVSAVGKSSQVAVQAKEFTLQYISDTFVNWIMEQGGFDSMLSGSESDPDLD